MFLIIKIPWFPEFFIKRKNLKLTTILVIILAVVAGLLIFYLLVTLYSANTNSLPHLSPTVTHQVFHMKFRKLYKLSNSTQLISDR